MNAISLESADVDKLNCLPLLYTLKKHEVEQYGIDCVDYDDIICKASAYKWMVESGCDLTDDIICKIKDLINMLDKDYFSCETAEEEICTVQTPCSEIGIEDITPERCVIVNFKIEVIQ